MVVTNGAQIQFDTNVKRIGFGLWNNFFSSPICRFKSAGYIIKNKHMPMGIDIPLNCMLLIVILNAGKYWDRNSPKSMHNATHTARYFSKTPRRISDCSAILFPLQVIGISKSSFI